MKVALISCSNKKKSQKCEAEKMYSESTLFKLTLQYCKQQQFDKIYILSAKYGILPLNQEIEPYNLTLNKMRKEERVNWGIDVSNWISENLNNNDEIYIFAGKNYYKYISILNNIILPFRNMRIGERLKWLKENTKNENVEC